MNSTPVWSLGVVAALLVLTSSLPAQTQETAALPTLSVEDAIAIALEAQTGTIAEAELDEFEGKPAYDIEVINSDGLEIEFKIDAETGAILNTWVDDDPSNDPVSEIEE